MKNVEALADEHQWGVVKIQAPEAWQELGTLSGEGVIIATVDTGDTEPIPLELLLRKGNWCAPGAKWAACRGVFLSLLAKRSSRMWRLFRSHSC
ncbi:M-protease [Orchesella cincta]|uniref:M-protease n=1 Tax=Orchesella cincta TaxID=48709 RepID=A0A1D2MNW9_ORCCI|nr:M-protease [Orchesella cincta]